MAFYLKIAKSSPAARRASAPVIKKDSIAENVAGSANADVTSPANVNAVMPSANFALNGLPSVSIDPRYVFKGTLIKMYNIPANIWFQDEAIKRNQGDIFAKCESKNPSSQSR